MKLRPLATVGALIIAPDSDLLLIRTHKWGDRWGVPGGKIEYGETIKEALKREIKEETNLDIREKIFWGPVQEAVQSPEFYRDAHFILLNFFAFSTAKDVRLNDEAQAYRWLSLEEALSWDFNLPTSKLLKFYKDHLPLAENLACL